MGISKFVTRYEVGIIWIFDSLGGSWMGVGVFCIEKFMGWEVELGGTCMFTRGLTCTSVDM